MPAFFDHLQRKAGEAGVNLRRWDRKAEEPVGEYVKVPVSIEMTGTFYQLLRYFSLLSPSGASSAANERIVSVENIELRDPKIENDAVLLTARFTASTFRQDSDAPVPELDNVSGGKVEQATKLREERVEAATGAGGDEATAPAGTPAKKPVNPSAAGAERLTNPTPEGN